MESEKVWFENGLQFECTKCGDCCRGEPGYVWVSKDEINSISLYLNMTTIEFANKFLRNVDDIYSLIEKSNGDCIFYDNGCTIYNQRPLQCKTFPFWNGHLISKDIWDEISKSCSGMNNGIRYSKGEILKCMRDY